MNEMLYRFGDNVNSVPWHYLFFIIVPLIIWSITWKGFALWRAARRGDKKWFVALLIINTFGLLEIVYIFFVTKKSE